MDTHKHLVGLLYIQNGIYQFQFTTEFDTEKFLIVDNIKECITVLKQLSRETHIPSELDTVPIINVPDQLLNMEAAIITTSKLVIYPDKFPVKDRELLSKFLFSLHSLEVERLAL